MFTMKKNEQQNHNTHNDQCNNRACHSGAPKWTMRFRDNPGASHR